MTKLTDEKRNNFIKALQTCSEEADEETIHEIKSLISLYGPTGIQKFAEAPVERRKTKSRKGTKTRSINTPGLRINSSRFLKENGWTRPEVIRDRMRANGVRMPRDDAAALAEIKGYLIKNSKQFVENDGEWNVRSNLKKNGQHPPVSNPTPEPEI